MLRSWFISSFFFICGVSSSQKCLPCHRLVLHFTGYLPGDSLYSFVSPAKCFFHYVHFLMHISVIRKCALGNFPGYLHYSQFVRAALATVTREAELAELKCSREVEGKWGKSGKSLLNRKWPTFCVVVVVVVDQKWKWLKLCQRKDEHVVRARGKGEASV